MANKEENLPPVLKIFPVQDNSTPSGQTGGNEFVRGYSSPAAQVPSGSVQCEDAGEGDLLLPNHLTSSLVTPNVVGPDGSIHVHGNSQNNSKKKSLEKKIKKCKTISSVITIILIIVLGIFIGVYFKYNYITKQENKTAYNQVGNFTPFVTNTTQSINDGSYITMTQTPLKSEDVFESYFVSKGTCEPNEHGVFEFSTDADTPLDHNHFSSILEHQWLNHKSTVTVHITADFSNGVTLDVYLYGYACFIQKEKCFKDKQYDRYLTVSASQPHFTIIVFDSDYYFLVVQSGDERQVYARWSVSGNFTYFSYDSSFSNICQVTEDNSPCDFEIEDDTCYFVETNGNNTINSVFYQYNLNIATKMKKDVIKNPFFWIPCIIIFICTCICAFICLGSLLALCVLKRSSKPPS